MADFDKPPAIAGRRLVHVSVAGRRLETTLTAGFHGRLMLAALRPAWHACCRLHVGACLGWNGTVPWCCWCRWSGASRRPPIILIGEGILTVIVHNPCDGVRVRVRMPRVVVVQCQQCKWTDVPRVGTKKNAFPNKQAIIDAKRKAHDVPPTTHIRRGTQVPTRNG